MKISYLIGFIAIICLSFVPMIHILQPHTLVEVYLHHISCCSVMIALYVYLIFLTKVDF